MSPLALRPRPSAPSALSAVGTLAWRAMLKIKHVPFQLFDVTITPIMFTLLFTYMFGRAIAGSPGAYIQYLLPGIVVQTIIFITVYTGVGLNTDIQKGLFDRFRSLPIWPPAPILGALAGDLFRYSVAAALIVVLGVILGFRPQGGATGVFLAFALVLVFAFALSWIWIIFAMKVKSPESVMTTSFIFLMPHVREQHLRGDRHDAPLASGDRPPQSGDPPGHRVAGADARETRRTGRPVGPGGLHRHRRHLGADRHAPLSPGAMTTGRRSSSAPPRCASSRPSPASVRSGS